MSLGTYSPEQCAVSMEKCEILHCAQDEGCYLQTRYCNDKVKLISKAVCAKKNPCANKICKSGSCQVIDNGIHPPSAACMCNTDPCDDYDCPDKKRCFFPNTDNNGDPCGVMHQCVSVPECDHCGYGAVCLLDINDAGQIFGQCNGGKKSHLQG